MTICNKHGGEFNFPENVGLRCYENGRDMPTDVGPWFLIDRAIAYPWSYVNDKRYRDGADYHVRSIVDVVSRGGIFLLSLTPKGDGSIPPEEREIMKNIGELDEIKRRGHLRQSTLRIHAEGPTITRGLKETTKAKRENSGIGVKNSHRRTFVLRKRTTISMPSRLAWPDNGKLQIQSLAEGCKETIHSVSLIGSNKQLKWEQSKKYLEVTVPEKPQGEYAFTFKIQTQ